ncbi:TniQ family protein [Agrobacterium pusense]|uniref:TniQ family protein n=1 Tax=Agrobacterium pusense TaxID=648995 RepID=UPI0037C051A7
MKPILLLPLAPRPFEDELISSWQGRVVSRYALGVDAIDTWLHLGGSVSEDRDFDPDLETLRRWTRACRIRSDVVEKLALSRHAAPLGHVLRSRWRGICAACLEDDRRNERDQYLRRAWSRAETVACPIHRLRLRYFCPGCFTRCHLRSEYRDGLVELICSGCLTAVSRAPPAPFELRHAELLIAMMEAVNAAEEGRGETTFATFEKATRFLWSASANTGRPEIALFGVDRPFGRAPIPVTPDAPMARLSVTWRCSTLLTIAQMLDIGSARSDFGPPGEWLTFAFQQFGNRVASDPCLPDRPKAKSRRVELAIRSDADYLRLASAAVKDPRRNNLSALTPRNRSKAISRLARNLLSHAEARTETPRP